MNTSEMLEKFFAKNPASNITALFRAGKFADAMNAAAGVAWGIWDSIGEHAGLPHDEAARDAWLAADRARRAAKYAKR